VEAKSLAAIVLAVVATSGFIIIHDVSQLCAFWAVVEPQSTVPNSYSFDDSSETVVIVARP
jgi:hypothetical protein